MSGGNAEPFCGKCYCTDCQCGEDVADVMISRAAYKQLADDLAAELMPKRWRVSRRKRARY